ncbi:hypothetical protein BDD14_0777 [Edaphobacter modestus]|uniref:TonB-dependent transporter Oar-like beta-barrel domain-containing protein n=1 Tax=Edaphobacter modestus TaxID=388466 RepID=A0A4V2G438_9BACT|nr:hypothetical protein BDD14_0777 [Edaphobacter modestus]
MVQLYNSLQPVPTQNNPLGSNFAYTQITPQTYRDYTGRVDYKFTSKDNFFVRYTRATTPRARTNGRWATLDSSRGLAGSMFRRWDGITSSTSTQISM